MTNAQKVGSTYIISLGIMKRLKNVIPLNLLMELKDSLNAANT